MKKSFYHKIENLVLIAGSMVAALLLMAITADAQRAFTRKSPLFTIYGDAIVIGNRIMEGAVSTSDNDATTMSYIDADGDIKTALNSGSATLAMPAGSTVMWAGLYWGGRSTNANRNMVKFMRAPNAYKTYTATQVDDGNSIGELAGENTYQCFSDVTAYVASKKNGTYWAGDIQSTTGLDAGRGYYGGWALVVIYSNSSQPLRSVQVMDGYDAAGTADVIVPLSGFLAPSVPGFVPRIGTVVWDGDLNQTGDNVRLDGNLPANDLVTAINPSDNFNNSTVISAPRNPSGVNNWGVDINYFNSNVMLPVDVTSTTVYFTTTADVFIPGVLVFSVPVNPVVLPVTWASFKAVKENTKVRLSWSTASEINCLRFDVQRSNDNSAWTNLGDVKGSGSTSTLHKYEFLDINCTGTIAPSTGFTLYYRIKQVDYDGTASYSGVCPVKITTSIPDFSIYPNPAPAASAVTISSRNYFESAGAITAVRIFNSKGKDCSQINSPIINNSTVDIKDLKTGLYLIEISAGSEVIHKKLMVE